MIDNEFQSQNKTVYKGRGVIYTNYEAVDETNVVEVVNESLAYHRANVSQIQYLWDYYRGIQPVLNREKPVRPQICNKIVENHAQEIVAFKIGYQLAEPLQYTCRSFETEDSDMQNSPYGEDGSGFGTKSDDFGTKFDQDDDFSKNRPEQDQRDQRHEDENREQRPEDENERPEERDQRPDENPDERRPEDQRPDERPEDQQRQQQEQRPEDEERRPEDEQDQEQRPEDREERPEDRERRDQEKPEQENTDQENRDQDNPDQDNPDQDQRLRNEQEKQDQFGKDEGKFPFGQGKSGSGFGFEQQNPNQTLLHLEDDDEYQKRLKDVNELNTLMFAEDKMSADRDLFEWMVICGVGYRMAEADKDEDIEDGGAPFEIYTLDPRNTFVVYSRAYHHKPVMAVWTGIDPIDDVPIYNVYTPSEYFRIKNNQIDTAASGPHSYGSIPIIEYRLNNARMGVFEPVLPLLDAINLLESNRLDGIEQTVQSLIKFINCDVDENTFEAMLQLGAVKVSSPEGVKADVDVVKSDLDQTSTQVTKDDLYAAVINICGMPNRNGQSGSTSDTGAAVLLRDGWTLAESHAKGYELQFKRAERDFLKVILAICDQSKDTDINLRVRDIELAFNRRNYENILVKSQVLTTMLSQNKIHPQLAFQSCGLFTDPDAAYLMSKKYNEENREQFMQNNPLAATLYTGQQTSIGSQANVPGPDNGDNEDKKSFPPRKS